jgi:hypothetical protein
MANRSPNTTNAAAKRKTKTPRPRVKKAEEAEEFDRFGVLLEEAQKFCEGVGLHKDLIGEILKTDSPETDRACSCPSNRNVSRCVL